MNLTENGLSVMDIYSPRGTKVRFSWPNRGYDHHQELANKHLKVGEVYRVESTDVHDSSSTVCLCEFPGIKFNTIMFSDTRETCPHCGQIMKEQYA